MTYPSDMRRVGQKEYRPDLFRFRIIEYGSRYIVTDTQGNVVDDANGYGFKTRQKAFLAINHNFGDIRPIPMDRSRPYSR